MLSLAKRFLYNFLDTAVVNSFVIFKHLNPGTTMTHFGFHFAITKQLVQLYSKRRFGPQRPFPTPAPDPTAAPAAEPVTALVPVVATVAQSPSTERPLEVDQLFVVPQREIQVVMTAPPPPQIITVETPPPPPPPQTVMVETPPPPPPRIVMVPRPRRR